ncbi:MAG: hypothetical protein U0169_23415 [Polyangiaceae bacterium]
MIGRRMLATVGLGLLVGAVLVANVESSAPAAVVAANTVTGSDGRTVPVLNDWFALVSGCRAKNDIPGDVSLEAIPADPMRPDLHRVRFHLDKLEISSDKLGAATPVKFARECAVRLNINPPAGKKIVAVRAHTQLQEDKSSHVKLTVANELKIGKSTLGRTLVEFPAGSEAMNMARAIDLAPGKDPGQEFPALECGEPKIIGFDYTWIAERESATDRVRGSLSGARTLEIEADLADCK